MIRTISAILVCVTVAPAAGQEVDWSAYGRDVHGTRYSPASRITRENVTQLDVAWTYSTGEADAAFATAKPASFETTPLVQNGVMYVGTPLGRVIALDAATGRDLGSPQQISRVLGDAVEAVGDRTSLPDDLLPLNGSVTGQMRLPDELVANWLGSNRQA